MTWLKFNLIQWGLGIGIFRIPRPQFSDSQSEQILSNPNGELVRILRRFGIRIMILRPLLVIYYTIHTNFIQTSSETETSVYWCLFIIYDYLIFIYQYSYYCYLIKIGLDRVRMLEVALRYLIYVAWVVQKLWSVLETPKQR